MIVLAHRGLRSHGPENSLAGLAGVASAAAKGIPIGVELDARRTADHVLVAVHDDCILVDVTDPKDRMMWNEDWYESQQHWLGDRCPPRFDDALRAIGTDVPMIDVDIKERGITEAVVNAISGIPPEIVALSAHIPDVIYEARQIAPAGVKIGMSVTRYFHFGDDAVVDLIERTGADFLFAGYEILSTELVERLHARGKEVGAYTVNDPATLQNIITMGVDFPCTDKPAMAIVELESHVPEETHYGG